MSLKKKEFQKCDRTIRAILSNDRSNQFMENIDMAGVNELCSGTDSALSMANGAVVDINSVVERCNKILLDAARKSGNLVETTSGEKGCSSDKTGKFKPWFNHECNYRRKGYHRAKHCHWRSKTAASRNNLVQESKRYKKCLNKQYRLFQHQLICKLRKLENVLILRLIGQF